MKLSRLPLRMGLTARLLLLGLVPGLLAILLMGWLLERSISDSLLGGYHQRLQEKADRIEASLTITENGQWALASGRNSDEFSQIFSGWYWQLLNGENAAPEVAGSVATAASVTPVIFSRSLWDGVLTSPSTYGRYQLMISEDPRGRSLLGIERAIAIDGHPARLQIFGPADIVMDDLRRIHQVLMLMLVFLVVSGVIATLVQVRVGLRPLARLRSRLKLLKDGVDEVVSIAHGTDDAPAITRLGRGFGPDLDPLATEIDGLLERNARMVARGRSHAADLSHALKTPLARLSAQASRQTNVPAPLVLDQVQSINGLIERHLTRTSASTGEQIPHQPAVVVLDVVRQLVALMQQIRPEQALSWNVDVPATLRWRGDVSDLEEMLGNLLDNASKWARTTVQVTAERSSSQTSGDGASQILIRIADDGPGIAAEDLSAAGRRGQRFDESTPGTGLGLSIVADIAHTWGGALQLKPSEQLGGLEVCLVLPG